MKMTTVVRLPATGLAVGLVAILHGVAAPAPPDWEARARAALPDLRAVYEDLHAHPELSLHEERTAGVLSGRLRALGFEVTTGVGGHGLVALLRNGPGPTVMLRTDLDALPVEEQTGLPYASRATGVSPDGTTVPTMHACAHDLHMTALLGTATLLSQGRDHWQGTLMLVGQPAEEIAAGARRMLDEGLFDRFGRPESAIAVHVSADLPAGEVGWSSGNALASADSVDVVIHGRGGHGAYPHRTVDPIVIAARTVLALQTLVSRETNPLEPAVITVGSFHGGTKHNIIPDRVDLMLTVRAYSEAVRERLLGGIERMAKAEAAAAGAPREPEVTRDHGCPATINDPALSARVGAVLRRVFGAERARPMAPVMGAEDFSWYGRAGVPAVLFWVGGAVPGAADTPRPSLHSSLFAPPVEVTLPTAVLAETSVLLELLGRR